MSGETTVIRNGGAIPLSQARVPVMAPAVTYAALAFEGVRAYWNADAGRLSLFRLDAHLARMAFSMRMLKFDDPPSIDAIGAGCVEALKRNGFREDAYLRINAYVDENGDMTATGPISWDVIPRSRGRTAAWAEGRPFCVSTWRRLSDNASPPRVKTAANYMNGRLAAIEAKERGFFNAIILTERGTVAEGPGGCIFIVRDGVLTTPSRTSGILESVTRDTLLTLARENGIPVEEREVDRTELYLAEEGFYCGTGQEMTPIVSVDGMDLGTGRPGDVTRRLQHLFDAVVRGTTDAHAEWRLDVPPG